MAAGGGRERFPPTHRSVVDLLRSDEAEERIRSLALVTRAYHAPVYEHLRARWRLDGDAALELTQEFFTTAVDKGWLAGFDPAKGRFRTYVRMCVDRLVSVRRRDSRRIKRGGAAVVVELEAAEEEMTSEGGSPEERFEREWVKSLFGLAVTTLREECERRSKTSWFTIFSRYDLDESDVDVSYASLGQELGLRPKDIANQLAAARREFRRIVLETLRQLTASEEEFREEARLLLGTDP